MTFPMRVGIQLSPGGVPDYDSWRSAVRQAEDLGVDVVFGYDHFHKPNVEVTAEGPRLLPHDVDAENFEGWTALASWAEVTTRVEIGLLVSGVGFRNPDLLADMARTVDHISGGRLILGVGAGWYEKDYTVYGYDFGTTGSRVALFAEALERIERRLPALIPPPVRDIPVLIGGIGERKMLPLVGRYADIWHSFVDLDTFRRKDDLVSAHAAAAGRDGSRIERAAGWRGPAAADAFAAAGVTLFTGEIQPTATGFDLGLVKEMLAWRDAR